MAQRLEVHELLVTTLGSNNVYFNPPTNTQMVYPCIRYESDDETTQHGDNSPYAIHERYTVTIIDRDLEIATTIKDKVRWLPTAQFSRYYPAAGLHHFVYTLFP